MIEIKPIHHCNAVMTLPGSKSYTHRALIISALADGESVLINPLRSEDTEYTASGLQNLGITIFWGEGSLHVLAKRGMSIGSDETIYTGNSGTSMRFLTALAGLRKGRTLLDGSERMRRRPIEELLSGLKALGVRAYSKEKNGYPPVIIESQGLQGGIARIRGEESSQFLSALLMVAPYASGDVCVQVMGNLSSRPYVDITKDVMSAFGVEVKCDEYHAFFVKAGQRYVPQKYQIEGDASNASYFFSAAAITQGKVRVENLKSNSLQGDIRFLDILKRMGCGVAQGNGWAEVEGKELHGVEIDMNGMPDLVPTLAITSAFARGETIMRDIGHLRLKESDRIKALASELGKMGIRVEEGEDWLRIEGGMAHGAEIDPHNDHRLAMSFAIAGLAIPGIRIQDEKCVNKSFPGFWERFQKFYGT
jgi:3-phosphoshikimate 1-carboxyvinyltransferase